MDDDMPFVEGTFRVEDGEWQVFIFLAYRHDDSSGHSFSCSHDEWESGVKGVVFRGPYGRRLNRRSVMEMLGSATGVTDWTEVRGPDSMRLR